MKNQTTGKVRVSAWLDGDAIGAVEAIRSGGVSPADALAEQIEATAKIKGVFLPKGGSCIGSERAGFRTACFALERATDDAVARLAADSDRTKASICRAAIAFALSSKAFLRCLGKTASIRNGRNG